MGVKRRRRTAIGPAPAPPNPSGLCECGCGQKTTIARYVYINGFQIPDSPRRFVVGHHRRGQKHPNPPKPGPAAPSWRGGRSISHGYVTIWVDPADPMHVMASPGQHHVYEHRLVMARHLGRPLARWEQVHHVNGDRADNRLENLQLRIGSHGAGQPHVCLDCGSTRVAPTELLQKLER